MTSRPLGVLLAAAVAIVACSCGGKSGDTSAWVWPNGDLASTRSITGSSITATSVGRLRVAWRFRVPGNGGGFGLLSSTPLMQDGVAYVQDTSSSVYALDLGTGRRLWAQRKQEPNDRPNGLALAPPGGPPPGAPPLAAPGTPLFSPPPPAGGQGLGSPLLVGPTEQFVN